jgi:hypothetical protein
MSEEHIVSDTVPESKPETNTSGEVPFKRLWVHQKLDEYIEKALRMAFFWETNDKKLGILIRFLHHSMIYGTLITYILLHTFLPYYILFLGFYIFCFIIWISHILTWGCFFNRIEQKLTGDTNTFVGPIMEIFHMPITPETTNGFMIMGGTVVLFFLTFELILRTILNIKSWIPF